MTSALRMAKRGGGGGGAVVPSGTQTALPAIGPMTLGTAVYTLPAGAIYVSTGGSDANSGTLALPKQTLSAAIAAAPAGGTVVMRAGTFRPSALAIAKALSVINYPNESVTWDGSISVSDSGTLNANSTNPLLTNTTTGAWTSVGAGVWRKLNVRLNGGVQYSHAVSRGTILPAFPTAAWPESLFVDGIPYVQQTSAANVNAANEFFYDWAGQALYMFGDPTGHLVEVGVIQKCLSITNASTGVQLKGFRIRRFADSSSNFGAISIEGPNALFENMVFQDCSTQAVFLNGDAPQNGSNFISRNCEYDRHGKAGGTNNGASGQQLLYNRITNNNSRQWDSAGEAGGWKIVRASNTFATANIVDNNKGHGLWWDVLCGAAVFNRNVCRFNQGFWQAGAPTIQGPAGAGIMYEVSKGTAVIIGNICFGQTHGVLLASSQNLEVWNNTLCDNSSVGLMFEDGNRTDIIDPSTGSRIIPIACRVRNNILSGHDNQTAAPLQTVHDNTSAKTWAAMGWSSNFNAWYRKSTSVTPLAASLANGGSDFSCADVPAVRTNTAQDNSSVFVDNVATDPYIFNASAGNFAPRTALPAGQNLPSSLYAGYLGIISGVAVSIGAIQP